MNLINVFNYVTEKDEKGNYIHGGATYNINTHEFNPTSGYIVALIGHEKIVDVPTTLNEWQDIMTDYLTASVWDCIAEQHNVYLGFWIEEGKLYIDLSERYEDFETAFKVGFERGQKAIWDSANSVSIYLVSSIAI